MTANLEIYLTEQSENLKISNKFIIVVAKLLIIDKVQVMNKIAVLKKFAKELVEKSNGRVVNVFLFGSLAKGELHEESDIDILTVVNRKDDRLTRDIEDFFFDVMKIVGVFVSPTIIEKDTFEEMLKEKYPFIINIEKEGILLA